jgi:hypothetical protein
MNRGYPLSTNEINSTIILLVAGEKEISGMPYCTLQRYKKKELYAMGMLLSEDEVRRYGTKEHRVMVKAIYVWTSIEALESFQQLISATQHDADSPYCGLVQDMRAVRVDVLECDAAQLQDQLHRCRLRSGFVAIDPGPEQRVEQIDEFLAGLTP